MICRRSTGLTKVGPVSGVVTWVLGPVAGRDAVADLCALVRDSGAAVVICDVSRIVDPNVATIDALARLRLTAGRLDCHLWISGADDRLVDLLRLCGLSDVLLASLVEPVGQTEEGEEPFGAEEGVEPPDPPA